MPTGVRALEARHAGEQQGQSKPEANSKEETEKVALVHPCAPTVRKSRYGLVTCTFRLPVRLALGSMATLYVPVAGSVLLGRLKLLLLEVEEVRTELSGFSSFTATIPMVLLVTRTV